jgi:DNA repair exonuclease SbcCD nuclease subunit
MLKILHAADLHLDSAFSGRSKDATARLREALRAVPEQIADICRRESCDILLLAGDVFDATPTAETLQLLKRVLKGLEIPVFISPGNHDFCTPASPWLREVWPENVHIFTKPNVESVVLENLDCRIYGAGFTAMDCETLLENFQSQGDEKYHIAILHGDPVQQNSFYNPITQAQVAASGLHYLALGHVHKGGSFQAGQTLCAWPGCPMGRGFDELEEKGVLLVGIDETADVRFIPLDTPRFYELEAPVQTTASAAIAEVLPAVGNDNFYRITLSGECESLDLNALTAEFSQFPNLELRDKTQLPVDVWGSVGSDSLEGVYFGMLKEAMEGADEESTRIALLAAKISRKILDGGEVVLP